MSIADAEIRAWMETAIWSPSGDNCQPWTFSWDEGTLRIFHNSNRARHPLNFQNLASHLALGTLLESLDLVASHKNRELVVRSLRKPNDSELDSLMAEVEFCASSRTPDPLQNWLLVRATDRRLFQGGDLDSKMFLSANAGHIKTVPWAICRRDRFTPILEEYLLRSEDILLEHAEILPALLHWTRFSQRQARTTRDGLPWRNLGVQPWELPLLPVLRQFPMLLRLLQPQLMNQNRIRLRRQLESSAGVVSVGSPNANAESVVDAGRMALRIWLALTAQGYGVQPLTLSSLLAYGARYDHLPESFSPTWQRHFGQGQQILRSVFDWPENLSVVWMFRTGRSAPLPAPLRTWRRSVDDVWTHVPTSP